MSPRPKGSAQEPLPPVIQLAAAPASRLTPPDVLATALKAAADKMSRYGRIGEPELFYASFLEITAWHEFTWQGGRAERRVSTIEVDGDFADVTDRKWQRSCGTSIKELTSPEGRRDPQSRCKALADIARDIGAAGLVVPSAADRGQANIVVLPEAVDHAVKVVSFRIEPPPDDLLKN